jgi:hypothetical protein
MNDGAIAGDTFFVEGLKHLNTEKQHHIVNTIHAFGAISIREASCGRIASYLSLKENSLPRHEIVFYRKPWMITGVTQEACSLSDFLGCFIHGLPFTTFV